jgi:hypothetical protein
MQGNLEVEPRSLQTDSFSGVREREESQISSLGSGGIIY